MSAQQHSGSSANAKPGNAAIGWFCLGVVSILWAAVSFSLSYAPFNWNDTSILYLTMSWSPYSYIGLLVVGVVSLCIGFPSFKCVCFGVARKNDMDRQKRPAKAWYAVGMAMTVLCAASIVALDDPTSMNLPSALYLLATPYSALLFGMTAVISIVYSMYRGSQSRSPDNSSVSVHRSQKGG